ncbi:FluG domain-containing protein [Xylaria telfairii]|nr:FluG domain-containing protein [Xylaria telfairii]
MAPSQPLSKGRQRHAADFIRSFTQKEAKSRTAKRPEALTAAQRAALRDQLRDAQLIQPAYADNTKINIAGILRKWKRYCTSAKLVGTWRDVIQSADRAMAMDFLEYLCQTCKIKSSGTSWEYFRQFKQLHVSVKPRQRIDENDTKEILNFHNTVLIRRYKLQAPNIRGKDVADSDTLLVLLTYNIKFDTGIFSWERHRFNLSGVYQGLAFTGARPAEFVDGEKKNKDECLHEIFPRNAIASVGDDEENKAPDDHSRLLEEMISQEIADRGRPKALCYEDILLMIVRHPETGKDVLAMAIKLAHHKGADNKPKPTIFFFTLARRMIFCFISTIISLAVHDGAFASSTLTSVRKVFEAKNRGPLKCTPLRWKDEWLKRPVFRRYDDSASEDLPDDFDFDISSDSDISGGSIASGSKYRPLPYHQLKDDMKRQSLDAGEEKAIEPKAWRRGAANVANGNASDAVRDQMMRHNPKWATFNSAYINEKVGFHLQNAFLDEPTEDSLLAMLSHIGHMRDPRASKDMVPDEIWEKMPPDPEIVALEAERTRLKGGHYRIRGTENEEQIRELTKLIATKKAHRKEAIRADYRADYFYNRPTWDMDADGEEDEEYVEPVMNLQIPERALLAAILTSQPLDLSSSELLELRIKAVELMVALCSKRETKRNGIRRRIPAGLTLKEESPGLDPFPLLMDRRQCPRCIGDEALSHTERAFKYCRPAVMYDHFDKKHASQLGGAKQISCNHPKCRQEALEFKHLRSFKNHVESVHGVKLRA